jgi:predicted nucleic-acid-binding protein
MVSLIDTNVIIRFLAADVQEQHLLSVDIMNQIHTGERKVEILGEVLMEVLFIMVKQYKEAKKDVIEHLQTLLKLDGVVNNDKFILIEALGMMRDKNIDFVDALICTKSVVQGYGKISFDKDVMKKCEKS